MARTTMVDLIQRVRDMTATGVADYTVGNTSYWTDDHIQNVLDDNRQDVWNEQLGYVRTVNSSGSAVYLTYYSAYDWLERTDGGTAILLLRDSDGNRVGTANFTTDYRAGRFTFTADQAGTAYYMDGRTYDVYGAAADVWELKASHVADRYTFEADGGRFEVSKMVDQYERQAARYRSMSPTKSVSVGTLNRTDVVT